MNDLIFALGLALYASPVAFLLPSKWPLWRRVVLAGIGGIGVAMIAHAITIYILRAALRGAL